ncbi:MAG: 3-hydroxyacyl-ACP dehydratase FabZ family protein [Candidatus Xenobium sp.]|nr:beta-hydroxyacyl-ACP dehydratase [Burkholderiales bacterium]
MADPKAGLTPEEVLARVPQQRPFRFVDEILELDSEKITGRYTFRPDESFYEGHFPGRPVTPGVILLECMCQVGVVALGIYLLSREVEPEEIPHWTTMFADATVEFCRPVLPGERVTIRGTREIWRRRKLRSRIEMYNEEGVLVASATASGMGVRHE